jgi:hypothetical protein
MDERRRKRPRVEAHTILPGVKFECDLYKEDYNTVLGFMLVSQYHTLAQKPSASDADLSRLQAQVDGGGARVLEVRPGSPAADSPILVGDTVSEDAACCGGKL